MRHRDLGCRYHEYHTSRRGSPSRNHACRACFPRLTFSPTYIPVYPSHPFNSSLCALISWIPTGFRELALQRKLARDVLDVLSRACGVSSLQLRTPQQHTRWGKSWFVTPSDVSTSEKRRSDDFWGACTCLGAPDEERTGKPNFEKLVVLAVILYCLHMFSPIRAGALSHNGSKMKLTNDIRRRWSASGEEDECLLWVWMILVDSWRAANETLLPTGVELLGQLEARWEDKTWTDMKRVLGRYFLNENFEARCRGYWMVGVNNPVASRPPPSNPSPLSLLLQPRTLRSTIVREGISPGST